MGCIYVPERIHELLGEVAVTQHQVVLQRLEVVQQLELIDEDLEQPLAGDLVRGIYGPFQPRDVVVLQYYAKQPHCWQFTKMTDAFEGGLTSARVAHLLPRCYPIAVITAVTDEIQTPSRREDLYTMDKCFRQKSN